jgi:hypothetical protein
MIRRKALALRRITILLILLAVGVLISTAHADGFARTAAEPDPAYGGQIAIVNNMLIKFGGLTPVGSSFALVSCVWVYDVHGQWQRLPVSGDAPGLVLFAAAPFGNAVFLFFGQGGTGGTGLSPDVYSFDPGQYDFQKVPQDLMAPGPQPVIYGSAAAGTDGIYVTGGRT